MSFEDRTGQVWMLPLSEAMDKPICPCLVLRQEVELLQPKMSEYRLEKRVATPVLELLNLLTGELERWYEHVPLEQEHPDACWRLLP